MERKHETFKILWLIFNKKTPTPKENIVFFCGNFLILEDFPLTYNFKKIL